MIVLAATLAAALLAPTMAPAGAATNQPPQATPPPAAPKKHRWIDWQVGSLDLRYRFIETSDGVLTSDSLQHKQTFKAGLKFDTAGRYSLQALAGSGNSFVGSWDNLGPGIGDPIWNFNLRQLYLQAVPVVGIEGLWGGTNIARGEHTEITSFDNDNFIIGGRVAVKRPKQLYLDEISVTAGYLGDLRTPNVIKRFDRWDEHNYTQVLVAKKLGAYVSLSADWSEIDGISTLRQAARVSTKQWLPVDMIRFENYQRIEGTTGYGFAISAERALHPRVIMAGGYADIDEHNGTLNGDRYIRGKRVFVEPRITVLPELTLSFFYTQAFANDFHVDNDTRFDAVLSYNVLRALQRVRAW